MTSNELIEKQISSVRRNTTSTTQIYSTKHVEEKANLPFPYLQHPQTAKHTSYENRWKTQHNAQEASHYSLRNTKEIIIWTVKQSGMKRNLTKERGTVGKSSIKKPSSIGVGYLKPKLI